MFFWIKKASVKDWIDILKVIFYTTISGPGDGKRDIAYKLETKSLTLYPLSECQQTSRVRASNTPYRESGEDRASS